MHIASLFAIHLSKSSCEIFLSQLLFYFIGKSVVRQTWNHEFAKQISQECEAFFFIFML